MKNIAKESKFSKLNSKNEYFHVKIRNELLAVLDEKELNETSAFTQQINTAIRTQMKRKSLTLYFRKQNNFKDEESVSSYEKIMKRLKK